MTLLGRDDTTEPHQSEIQADPKKTDHIFLTEIRRSNKKVYGFCFFFFFFLSHPAQHFAISSTSF